MTYTVIGMDKLGNEVARIVCGIWATVEAESQGMLASEDVAYIEIHPGADEGTSPEMGRITSETLNAMDF